MYTGEFDLPDPLLAHAQLATFTWSHSISNIIPSTISSTNKIKQDVFTIMSGDNDESNVNLTFNL
jgi:hypothetical protein